MSALGERNGAIEALNTVRTLRGLKEYNQDVNGDLVDAIFKERQRELMGEGHRWYDMVRYHKIKQRNSKLTSLINSGGIYWPVSRKLINQNNLLTQNPYWN